MAEATAGTEPEPRVLPPQYREPTYRIQSRNHRIDRCLGVERSHGFYDIEGNRKEWKAKLRDSWREVTPPSNFVTITEDADQTTKWKTEVENNGAIVVTKFRTEKGWKTLKTTVLGGIG